MWSADVSPPDQVHVFRDLLLPRPTQPAEHGLTVHNASGFVMDFLKVHGPNAFKEVVQEAFIIIPRVIYEVHFQHRCAVKYNSANQEQ